MNKELKAKWVAALRSGEYKQGHSMLKTPSGEYCCLGVLADLCSLDLDEKLAGFFYVPSGTEGYPEELTTVNLLPRQLAFKNDGMQHETMNPTGKAWSFLEIADWIESNIPED